MAEKSFRDMSVAEMEKSIARFNERVGAAQRANPPARDWVKSAMKCKGGKRCPVRLKRLSFDVIVEYGDALSDLFCEFPDDAISFAPYEWMIGFQPASRRERINPVEALMKEMQWVDEWGARWAHAVGGVGAIQIEHPLKDWGALDEYLATRMPDPRGPGRLDEAAAALAPHRGKKYCIGVDVLGLLEVLRNIRGMEELFMDFHANPAEVNRLIEAVVEFQIEVLRGWGAMGADCVMFGDDWGMQTGLQISPVMWREMFKPHYKRMFDEAHTAGVDILFHTCGNAMDIVGDLIEVGVDILDPIQPGCMDIHVLAERYGGRVAWSGAVDVQGTMVFGQPEDVKKEIRHLVDTLGKPFGNSLMVSPANSMTPDIPFANLRAMFEACHER
jgi:uroporphyrinogen decarboxylase